jgi:hypothetical protein
MEDGIGLSAPELRQSRWNERLKRVFELTHFRKDGNGIWTEIRILRFEGCLKLFAIPAQERVGLLFFFQSGGNR